MSEKEELRLLLQELTLEEKVSLLSGIDNWHTAAISRIGLRSMQLSDGPAGVRGEHPPETPTTSVPCGTSLAATWDPELVGEIGRLLGAEARKKGVHVLLGPTVGVHRTPLAGRSFESYSEDPVLSARMAVAFIKGVQSQSVAATVKHFVGADAETHRHTVSSVIDPAALREVYLLPFETAVVEAQVGCVMAAYNRVDGVYACENRFLLVDVLKGEWGFDGLVMSDWGAAVSTAGSAQGGLDLEMPGPPAVYGERLVAAVRSGEVDETVIDDKVLRLLRLARRVGALGPDLSDRGGSGPSMPAELLRRAAASSFVLLSNRESLLPLDRKQTREIAVIGPNTAIVAEGGGSAAVRDPSSVSVLAGISAACGLETAVTHEIGCVIDKVLPAFGGAACQAGASGDQPGFLVEYFSNSDLEGEADSSEISLESRLVWVSNGTVRRERQSVRMSFRFRPETSGDYEIGIAALGSARVMVDGRPLIEDHKAPAESEIFMDLGDTRAPYSLSAGQEVAVVVEYVPAPTEFPRVMLGYRPPLPADLIDRAAAAAARADVAVLVVGLNDQYESEAYDRHSLDLPGDQDRLVERVLAANPATVVVVNAGAPVNLPWADRAPALIYAWYPGQQFGSALAGILFGEAEPGGRLPVSLPGPGAESVLPTPHPDASDELRYRESLAVGYRLYQQQEVAPRFWFGHGLSYTSFEYDRMTLSPAAIAAGEDLQVSVRVRNTGSRPGWETVQLYVSGKDQGWAALKAFQKVLIPAGEGAAVTFRLQPRDLAHWDADHSVWKVEPGSRQIRVGPSAGDTRLSAELRVRPA